MRRKGIQGIAFGFSCKRPRNPLRDRKVMGYKEIVVPDAEGHLSSGRRYRPDSPPGGLQWLPSMPPGFHSLRAHRRPILAIGTRSVPIGSGSFLNSGEEKPMNRKSPLDDLDRHLERFANAVLRRVEAWPKGPPTLRRRARLGRWLSITFLARLSGPRARGRRPA